MCCQHIFFSSTSVDIQILAFYFLCVNTFSIFIFLFCVD
nr:MAG TPA_asm: hypothetical protein [Caudoviricetes sp.]